MSETADPAVANSKSAPGPDGPASDAAPGNTGAFTVALRVELAEMQIPLSRLQAMGEGAVLALAASPGPLPVRLAVGDRELARGTLVSVGSGYGILVGDDGPPDGPCDQDTSASAPDQEA
ncbi:FliM/FliN family flagellar motor C-terminal domain-containing protein [Novosphingobium beihaiensis]|uniref:FliM/FliN family flagellar motor C-terminal domain-containing protein n=1 Tax=Novosphingobium beihaiensis TaxID=2930389 RepID=A0ABT0BVI5_9SPHN|nr:FliM/FliN family flagellar motor C-terminal domain-containing protein [Novosphingobium beihaiensis]MCJ2189081.1 FliM/FliN family flagellar motor C-terminal domain-containing protein [Novosphingobium beihaiensis]